MPSWLILVLFIAACVVAVGLQAAGVTGHWRGFRTAVRTFGGGVLAIALIGAVMTGVHLLM